MKKLLACVSVLLMVFSLSVPALASERESIHKVDASPVRPLELTLLDRQTTPGGRVEVYSFHIPDSGCYYEVPDFRSEQAAGSHVTVEGTWEPSYAQLNVMLKETEFGTSVYSYVDCNEPTTYGLWHHAEWGCFLKAEGKSISGTLRIQVS